MLPQWICCQSSIKKFSSRWELSFVLCMSIYSKLKVAYYPPCFTPVKQRFSIQLSWVVRKILVVYVISVVRFHHVPCVISTFFFFSSVPNDVMFYCCYQPLEWLPQNLLTKNLMHLHLVNTILIWWCGKKLSANLPGKDLVRGKCLSFTYIYVW